MPNILVRNPVTNWLTGTQILESELESLDTQLTGCADGDDGSTHAPASILTIQGTFGLQLTGPLAVARGGVLTTGTAGATITCGDSDWPQLDPSNQYATHVVMQPCAEGSVGIPNYHWHVRREDGGLQAYSPIFDDSSGLGLRTTFAYMRLRPHDKSKLTQVVLYFRLGYPHTQLPQIMPQVRVLRVDAFGNSVPLTSTASGADIFGHVAPPTPAGPAAWYNNGLGQSLVIPCDQNNVIDLSQYSYRVELVEEGGLTGYPWQITYLPAVNVCTTGANLASLSGSNLVDGFTVGATSSITRVLVKDQTNASLNGIYLASNAAGGWTRAPDLSVAQQFTTGFVVPVLSGLINQYAFYQSWSAITSWNPGNPAATPNPIPGTPLVFLPKPDASFPAEGTGFIAHGIIWQSVQCTYTGIADLRAQ